MTPAARVAAAIAVLDEVLAGAAAEKALTGWARGARYAGAKDRAAVRDHVFQALRCRRSYACLGGAATGRGLMLGALRAAGHAPDDIFTGARYAPAPLSRAEAGAGQAPAATGDRLDLPDWLLPHFRNSLGAAAAGAADALRGRAPVMLRVDRRKGSAAAACAALAADGIAAAPHPIAATALRVSDGARRIAWSEAYRGGLVELQDGSSQAAMARVTVAPGARVLDYCAGGGGKTLALAARAEATWYAHDAHPRRMADLPARAARAGIRVRQLEQSALAAAAPFDLVICDVPCSGSGTWRRTPDAKWRLTPAALNELTALQAAILRAGADLVAPGGRLVYATCSVLRGENDVRIGCFLCDTPGWQADWQAHWPVSEGGDGFFAAQLVRTGPSGGTILTRASGRR